MNAQSHKIYARLDEPRRVVGLTLDELIPMGFIGVMCFLTHYYLTGMAILALTHATLKYFKQGRGFEHLLSRIFWVMPGSAHKIAFKRTPEFVKRHFVR